MDLLVILLLSCPITKITPPELKLTEYGRQQMEMARAGCKKAYGPNSCLVEFIIYKDRDYGAICQDLKDIPNE